MDHRKRKYKHKVKTEEQRRMVAAWKASGLTLQEAGRRMGLPDKSAKQRLWQLFYIRRDPTLGTLRSFAEVVGISLEDIIAPLKP